MTHAKPGFGRETTPHMLLQRFVDGAWGAPRLVPSAPLELSPLTQALHFGESVFEGLKAFRQPDGGLALFRPLDHLRRLGRSCERLCIPPPAPEPLLTGLLELVRRDAAHAPAPPDSLYVRPVVFADQPCLAPVIAESYTLLVLLAPVPAYFGGAGGVRLCTETRYVRAAPGGTGSVKCAGNYAASLLAQREARRRGFDEVLWLDAHEHRWVEETGSMNLMLVRDGALSTPPLSDTILAGMTRDSLLTLARDEGLAAEERPMSTDAADWESVSEAFSAGTAAGTAHIREIVHQEQTLFAREEPGPLARRLGGRLDDLRFGRAPDPHGWLLPVDRR